MSSLGAPVSWKVYLLISRSATMSLSTSRSRRRLSDTNDLTLLSGRPKPYLVMYVHSSHILVYRPSLSVMLTIHFI